jgi:hypothetical protein
MDDAKNTREVTVAVSDIYVNGREVQHWSMLPVEPYPDSSFSFQDRHGDIG